MLTAEQKRIIKGTWSLVFSNADAVGALFYERLFQTAPETRSLFTRTTVPEQSKKLLATIGYVISKLDALEDVVHEVEGLGRRHMQYGVKDEQYAKVGEALLWTLHKGLDEAWNNDVKEAWTACYTLLATVMQNACANKAAPLVD